MLPSEVTRIVVVDRADAGKELTLQKLRAMQEEAAALCAASHALIAQSFILRQVSRRELEEQLRSRLDKPKRK